MPRVKFARPQPRTKQRFPFNVNLWSKSEVCVRLSASAASSRQPALLAFLPRAWHFTLHTEGAGRGRALCAM